MLKYPEYSLNKPFASLKAQNVQPMKNWILKTNYSTIL